MDVFLKTNPTLLSGIKYDPVFSVIHGWLSKAKNVEIDVSFQKAYHFLKTFFDRIERKEDCRIWKGRIFIENKLFNKLF